MNLGLLSAIFFSLVVNSVHSQTTADPEHGKIIYKKSCVGCHAPTGSADDLNAKGLKPVPRNLYKDTYRIHSTSSGSMPTDADVIRTITKGVYGTWMVAFDKLLNDQDIQDVAAYIQTLNPRFSEERTPLSIPTATAVRPSDIKDGAAIYKKLMCFNCHGKTGNGKGGALSSALQDENGNKMNATNFTLGVFKGGKDSLAILRAIQSGIGGTPMAGYHDAFLFGNDDVSTSVYEKDYTSIEIAELKAYIAKQPTSSEIDYMSQSKKDDLAGQRKWALVRYIQSLHTSNGYLNKFSITLKR